MARGKARPEAIPGSMGEGSNAALGHLGRNPLGRGPFRVSPCCSSLVYRQYTALVAPCETRNGPPSPPYLWCYQALRAMNRRLSESRIRSTCRELLGKKGRVSGRALCAELRKRFGAVGKTERVFAIWREETQAKGGAAAAVSVDIAELQRRLAAAEAAAAENLKRAELAEYREQAHQEKWAVEVDALRQRVKALQGR